MIEVQGRAVRVVLLRNRDKGLEAWCEVGVHDGGGWEFVYEDDPPLFWMEESDFSLEEIEYGKNIVSGNDEAT